MTYSKELIKQQHQKTVLDNGLTVISLHKQDIESVTIEVLVKVGSRYETKNINGIAHFIEHMNFKGTQKRSAKQIAEEFDSIGGYLNAYTTKENTVYSAKVLKEFLPLAMEVIADIMFSSIYKEEDIEKERNVILQELAQTEDVPEEMVFEYFSETSFANQALGRSIIGTRENILSVNKEQIIAFIEKYYVASNMIITVVGNCSHQELVKLINEYFTLKKGTQQIGFEPGIYTGGHYYKYNQDLSQTHMVIGYEGLSIKSEDYYKIEMLANLLGGSISSRLFQEIREKRGLVYSIGSFCQYFSDTGIFGIHLSASDDKINESLDLLGIEIENITHSITEDEIKRCLAQVKSLLFMGRETSDSWVNILASNYAYFGRYISCEEIWQGYLDIKVEELQTLAKKIFTKSKPISISALGNTKILKNYQEMHEMLTV